MTCLETQSKIIPYIEDGLGKEEKTEFLKHIKACENCKEELDIYYTLLVGMKKLDNEENVSINLKKDLENKIDKELQLGRKRSYFWAIATFLFISCICILGTWTYINFLKIIEIEEQQKIKEQQGDTYYLDYFGDTLFWYKEEK